MDPLTRGFDAGFGRLSALLLPRPVEAAPDLTSAEPKAEPSSRSDANAEALNMDLEFPPLLAARDPQGADRGEWLLLTLLLPGSLCKSTGAEQHLIALGRRLYAIESLS